MKIRQFIQAHLVLISALLSAALLTLQQLLSKKETSTQAILFALFIAALGVFARRWRGQGLTVAGIFSTLCGVGYDIIQSGTFTWNEFVLSVLVALLSAASAGLQNVVPTGTPAAPAAPGEPAPAPMPIERPDPVYPKATAHLLKILAVGALVGTLATSCSSTRKIREEQHTRTESASSQTEEVHQAAAKDSGAVREASSIAENSIRIDFDSAILAPPALDTASSWRLDGLASTPGTWSGLVITGKPTKSPAPSRPAVATVDPLQDLLARISGQVKSLTLSGKYAEKDRDSSYLSERSNFDAIEAMHAASLAEQDRLKTNIERMRRTWFWICIAAATLLPLLLLFLVIRAIRQKKAAALKAAAGAVAEIL